MSPENAECRAHREKLERIEKDIDGNGRPGLKDDVINIRIDVGNMKSKVTVLMWLFGLQFVASATYIVKELFG